MKNYKIVLCLIAALVMGSIVVTQVSACDGCLAVKAANTVRATTAIATVPVRAARAVLTRTVSVTVPTVTTDSCGQVTSTGCTTACVQAVLFPRLKARRLATGHSVLAQSSSVATVTTSSYTAPSVVVQAVAPTSEPTPAPTPESSVLEPPTPE